MIKDLLFPQLCLGCDTLTGSLLCGNCTKKYISTLKLNHERCNNSLFVHHAYLTELSGVYKKLIHSGKYRFNRRAWLLMGEALRSAIRIDQNSFVTYIPMPWARYCYRGFNQAKLLAKSISSPIKVLGRKNYSGATGKSKNDRLKSVEDSFVVLNRDLSKYSTCYLVDDVYTTGATINSAARLIKEAFPHLSIIAVTFAKTPKH